VEKLTLLKTVLGPYYRSGDEYLFDCLYCGHPKKKLSINLEKNKFKCWVCDKSGGKIVYLIKRFGTLEQLNEWKKLNNIVDFSDIENKLNQLFEKDIPPPRTVLELPPEFISLANENLPLSSLSPLTYLKKRRIYKRDIIRWKMGYCPEGEFRGRIIIPSFDCEGNVNYFIARSYDRAPKKYLNPSVAKNNIIFNELNIDFEKPVTIVEGVFDAVVVGRSAIPLLGSSLKESAFLFQKIVEYKPVVYLALDPDVSFKEEGIIKSLLKYSIETYKIDISNFKDVGEMTQEQFRIEKECAKAITSSLSLLFSGIKI
tara:strand:- start:3406 stop:4347 length:942 start_codon:yes stop_codon:yes gene_type:complete